MNDLKSNYQTLRLTQLTTAHNIPRSLRRKPGAARAERSERSVSTKRVGGTTILQRLTGRAKQIFYRPSPKRFRRITKKICEGFHRTLFGFQSDFNDFNRISEDSIGFQGISIRCQRFQSNFKDFSRISWISVGFQPDFMVACTPDFNSCEPLGMKLLILFSLH